MTNVSEFYKNNIQIVSETKNLQAVRGFLRDAVQSSGMVPTEWQNKITLAVDEAVSNIIEHAYEDCETPGTIDISIEATRLQFTVIINDSGKEFDPDSISEVDMSRHVQNRNTNGLGIFIMRRIMDEIKYTFKEGEKNELRMIKHFKR